MKRQKVVFTKDSSVKFQEDLFEDAIEGWFLLPGTPGYLSVGEVLPPESSSGHALLVKLFEQVNAQKKGGC